MSNTEAKSAPRPTYSMTGYATTQSTTEDGLAFTLTLKSVNHRFLDLNMRLPGDCDAVELLLRAATALRHVKGSETTQITSFEDVPLRFVH